MAIVIYMMHFKEINNVTDDTIRMDLFCISENSVYARARCTFNLTDSEQTKDQYGAPASIWSYIVANQKWNYATAKVMSM